MGPHAAGARAVRSSLQLPRPSSDAHPEGFKGSSYLAAWGGVWAIHPHQGASARCVCVCEQERKSVASGTGG